MKRILSKVLTGVLLGAGLQAGAQDIHFSQFYENALLRNPALTGIFTGDYKIGMDYRNQWSQAMAKPYSTIMISGETRVLVNREINDYISFGLAANFDKAGSINMTKTQVYPAIAYNKALDDVYHSYLSVGLTGGYNAMSVDQSKMMWGDEWNGNQHVAGSTSENVMYRNFNHYDVGAGVSLNSSLDQEGNVNYYMGVSAFHLNTPTNEFNANGDPVSRTIKWQFNAGFHSAFSEQFGVTLHGNYSYQQPFQEIIVGGFFTWRSVPVGLPSIFALNFGAFYRHNDAFIPMIRVDYKDVSIGFTQDVTNSKLASAVAGSSATEITLYLKGMFQHRKNPRDPMYCPRFEEVSGYNFR